MDDYIGKLVKQFESGNTGSLNLGTCGNDWGLSCGSYQLTLRWGNCIRFLKSNFPSRADKLYYNGPDIAVNKFPGTKYASSPDAVRAVWVNCYNDVGADKFFYLEHEWIRKCYYEPILKLIAPYVNPNRHSRMLQECMWSWSVHKGAEGAKIGFVNALGDVEDVQNSLAEDIIDKIYDERYRVNNYDRYGRGSWSEREELRAYCNVPPLPYNGTSPSDGTATGIITVPKPAHEPINYIVQSGAYRIKYNATRQQSKLRAAGFDCWINKVGVYYRCQCGSYIIRSNAIVQRDKLKAAGFDTVLIID